MMQTDRRSGAMQRLLSVLLLLLAGAEGHALGGLMGLGAALLNTDFMPPSLLAGPLQKLGTSPKPPTPAPSLTNTSADLAFSTMEFHRRMMNEFMCRGYVARSIMEEIERDAEQHEVTSPAPPLNGTHQRRSGDSLRAKMLMVDQGSANYHTWLKRSAMLAGVYDALDKRSGEAVQERADDDEEDDEEEENDQDAEEDEELQVVEEEKIKNQNLPTRVRGRGKKRKKPKQRPRGTKRPSKPAVDSESASQEHREPDYAEYPQQPQEVVYADTWSPLGFNMKDMYDITLTAIAFLAFGIFILNVFLSIITQRVGPQSLMVVTNSTSPSASLPVRNREDQWEEERTLERIARWAQEEPPVVPEYPQESVAKFALLTLQAALREPRCLQIALCRGNKETRTLEGEAKYWMPIWSLGMSWLARRGGGASGSEPGSSALFSGALENVRAAVLGLAGARCEDLFASC